VIVIARYTRLPGQWQA